MKTIPDDVLAALSFATKDGDKVILHDKMAPTFYRRVNAVLEAAGGKWNRKAKAHIFPGDAADALEPLLLTGEYATPKQDFQQFDTPREIAEMVIEAANLFPMAEVLEPSAGTGSLIQLALEANAAVWGCEIDPSRIDALRSKFGPIVPIWDGDFLNIPATRMKPFDRVVMNPPFMKGQDIAHVRHAYDFLKPGGRIVAIMSPGWTFRQDQKFVDFRCWITELGVTVENLPDQAFKTSGTNVNTIMVTIDKPS